VPQVQVPKGDGKRCSRSHSRTLMIAYHQIQNDCRDRNTRNALLFPLLYLLYH